MYIFISDFQSEVLLKHLELVWHLNSHKCFKAHKTLYCIDVFTLLQTNLSIDITSNSMLMYYIFIYLFDPADYYSPKKNPKQIKKNWKNVFFYFCYSRESVKLRLLRWLCFHAKINRLYRLSERANSSLQLNRYSSNYQNKQPSI